MEMNKSSIVAISLVIFITGIAFGNFAVNSPITGQVGVDTAEKPTVSVQPYTTYPGYTVEITITPGKNGIFTEHGVVYFHRITEANTLGVRKERTWQICGHSRVCKNSGTFKYIIPNMWSPGKYAAVTIDAKTGEKIRGNFIVGYSAPKGHA